MSTILATQVRKHTTARPTKAAGRYWKGKAPKGVAEAPSDSEEEEDQEQVQEEGDVPIGGEEDFVKEEEEESLPTRPTETKSARALNVSLKDVNISRDGKVIVAGREESGRTLMEEGMSPSVHPLLFSHQPCHVEESEEEEQEQAQAEEEEEASFRTYAYNSLLTVLLSRAKKKSPSQKEKKSPNSSSDPCLSPSTLSPLPYSSLVNAIYATDAAV